MSPTNPPDPMICAVSLKHLALITLVIQNSLLVIVMRYSRLLPGPQYFTTTAVLLSELSKLLICLGFYFKDERDKSASNNVLVPGDDGIAMEKYELPSVRGNGVTSWPSSTLSLARKMFREVFSPDAWKMLIPAALYTVQNNLQYVAVSVLDAATFQVTYQLKILTTALFSVLLLKRSLSIRKWISLLLLTAGVALVQMPTSSTQAGEASAVDAAPADQRGSRVDYQVFGLFAVACACLLSGMAGVYFEKVLKGTRTSLWVRNVQLSLFSIPPAVVAMFTQHGQGVIEHGFFYGYNSVVFAAIACQAGGGLIVAVVVKYADNILKGFATSVSIILSCIASVFLFDFTVTSTFLVGGMLVIYATYLYGLPDEQKSKNVLESPSAQDKTLLHHPDK